VTIVGDITVDRAIALTAATFGALPPRASEPPPPPAALSVRFPAATPAPERRTDTGRPDQAIAVLAWPAPDFFADMRRGRAIMLASDVLGNRLVDKVRVAQGTTYSPETRADLSQVFPGYGYVFSLVEMPPPIIPGFFQTVADIARDLGDHGITADEFERARNPHVAGLRKARLTNEYWLGNLTGALADPRRLALIRTTFPDYESLTPADLQAAARDLFREDRAWKLVIQAGEAPATAPPPPS
jgi:zinc protease